MAGLTITTVVPKPGCTAEETVPVKSLAAGNNFGLHHMHGNVWEWVADCWHDSYDQAPTNGQVWGEENAGELRPWCFARGRLVSTNLSAPARRRSATTGLAMERSTMLGFRLARTF